MSEDKARKKKSIKRKNSSPDSSKNKKNEDTDCTPCRPCHPEPQKPEDDGCSLSKMQRTDSSFPHGTPQVPPKKASPTPYHVRVNRTSSGSLYYKLSCFPRRRKPDSVNGQSGSTSSSHNSGVGDIPRENEATPRTEAHSQQDAKSTDKTKKKKKKHSKEKSSDCKTDVKEKAPLKDPSEKTLRKPGFWINSFKIVSQPKVSSNEIAARSRAFQESCEKPLKNAKEAAGSSSEDGDRKLKPLPTGPSKESGTHGERDDSALESSMPSAAPDAKEACLQQSVPSSSTQIFAQSEPQGLGTHSWFQSCTNLLITPEVWKLEATDSSVPLEDSEDAEEEMQIVEELLTARSEKKLDLAVAQTCGELTSMDIDSPEEDVHNLPVNTTCTSLLIVLDTNILISHLQFIKVLKTMELPGFGKPVLIIPWVVLQELDYMKNGKLLQTVKHKAIPAVQFIYVCLKNQDPQLWGQSMQQASQKMYGLSAENNDDRVLHCCIQYQKLYPNARHLLCTDDKNLCNKSLVSDVKAVFKADLLATIQNLIMTTKGMPSCLSWTPPKIDQVSKKNDTSGESTDETNPFRNVVRDLEKCLGQALSQILETEMKIAYEELWHEVLFLKPPWSLSDLLQCFKKHWIAVFGMIVKRDMKRELTESIDFLLDHLCKGATVDYMLIRLLISQSSTLLNAFSSRSNYDGVLPQACAQMSRLLKTISEVKDGCLQNSSEPKEAQLEKSTPEKVDHEMAQRMTCEMKSSEMQQLQNIGSHLEIWTVLENLCNTIAQYSNEVFQKLNEIQALALLQPITNLLPLQEAYVCLQKLMVTVKNIIVGIQRIMVTNSGSEDVVPLYNVLINNEVHVTNFTFSSQELYECLCQDEYRQKLTIGCYQLGVLEYTMKTVNESICLEAKNRGWM